MQEKLATSLSLWKYDPSPSQYFVWISYSVDSKNSFSQVGSIQHLEVLQKNANSFEYDMTCLGVRYIYCFYLSRVHEKSDKK